MDTTPELKSKLEDFYIVLIQPETDGNLGSIARVMKNFGFKNLILINPLARTTTDTAKMFAMNAKDILANCTILNFDEERLIESIKDYFSGFNVVIGTSAKGFSYKNIKRIPIFPYEMDFSSFHPGTKVAIVFGRESTGLTNEELQLLDFIIRIPTSPEYPTLNISHAVGILLYHIYMQINGIRCRKEREEPSHPIMDEKVLKEGGMRGQALPSEKGERDRLLELLYRILDQTPVPEYRFIRTKHALKNWIGRAFLSKKEVSLLYNFFKKVALCYKKPDLIIRREDNGDNETLD